jgi:hypothetical protein
VGSLASIKKPRRSGVRFLFLTAVEPIHHTTNIDENVGVYKIAFLPIFLFVVVKVLKNPAKALDDIYVHVAGDSCFFDLLSPEALHVHKPHGAFC